MPIFLEKTNWFRRMNQQSNVVKKKYTQQYNYLRVKEKTLKIRESGKEKVRMKRVFI